MFLSLLALCAAPSGGGETFLLSFALSASLPVVTGGEFFSPPREFMKVPPTYLQIVVGKGESDKGDLFWALI